jgi:hypothetical protein
MKKKKINFNFSIKIFLFLIIKSNDNKKKFLRRINNKRLIIKYFMINIFATL